MAAGDNSGRPPCLNFSCPGPLGNSQPSNSVFSMPASNGGAGGGSGGTQAAARRPNPQLGPGGGDSNGVSTGAQPTAQNSLQQSAAAGAAAAGAMATPASNMATGAASNATQAAAPTATPAAASVLVYREPVYNWQATKSTVKERFAFLFNNEVLSDVHFLVGKGMGVQRIPAHRWVKPIIYPFGVQMTLIIDCWVFSPPHFCPHCQVCSGRGERRVWCHVQRWDGHDFNRNRAPRCGTSSFSGPAEVSREEGVMFGIRHSTCNWSKF